jgi:hypothetical protein
MIKSLDRALSPVEFDILCLTHRLEMRSRQQPRQSTIQWRYSASQGGKPTVDRARCHHHAQAAEVFYRLAADANAERRAIIESERLARVRRSGLALAAGVAMAALAFGGVMTAWTDVAAAPGLRSDNGALSIAAADPREEVYPLLPELPVSSLAPFAPKVMETDPLVLDEIEDEGLIDYYDFVGPVGRNDDDARPMRDEARAVSAAEPVARRASRARPIVIARPSPQPHRAVDAPTAESEEEPIRGAMTFGRDELQSTQPTTLTRGQITVGIRSVARMVRNCARGEPDRTVRVDLVIEGSTGRVVNAHVRGYHERTTAGTCVSRALRRAQFPTFANAQLSLQAYPLVLR